MIELGKKYQTRDGRAVRILCVDGPNKKWPVLGVISGNRGVDFWDVNGSFSVGDYPADLIPVPTKHEGWGFYSASDTAMRGPVFFTKEDALRYNGELRAFRPRDAVIAHVTWED